MNTDALFLIVVVVMCGIFTYCLTKNKDDDACDKSECDKCPFPECEKK